MAEEAWRGARQEHPANTCEYARELWRTAHVLIEESHRLLDENYQLRRERARISKGDWACGDR
ncbi:hypothetical protein [Streptomyces endophyticus]|uniref:Uncharacterized protein n=1 Tax=Streptomyces endophyticus TaxID=714166 RepID=A0ABU6F214_9ACTN|nr:hypothetical protein [Streptomyces endophyticus]MEB8337513.1 hypothetical protein [Streptomyces endophyticus]